MKVQNYRAVRSERSVTPLANLLPLDTPLTLMIDPSNGCNFRCVFCPTGDSNLLKRAGRKVTTLGLDRYRKIISELGGFPRNIRVLHLYKDGEPLTNKNLAAMVRLAKESGRIDRIETTTNGALMTEHRARELIEAGLDGIRFSIYGTNDDEYRGIARTEVSFDAMREAVGVFFALKSRLNPQLHVHCKIVDTGLSPEQRARFLDAFAPIADSINIDPLGGWSGEHGERYKPVLEAALAERGIALPAPRQGCSELFTKLAINSNGRVSPCCVDWAHELIVGDTATETLAEIWQGQRLRALRLAQLRGERASISTCASCGYIDLLPAYANFDHALGQLRTQYEQA